MIESATGSPRCLEPFVWLEEETSLGSLVILMVFFKYMQNLDDGKILENFQFP